LLDGDGDVGLLEKRVIEIHLGDVAENHVEYVGGNLLARVGELVEGLVDVVGDDVILHGDGNLDEDVVFGFGFDVEGELLDAEIDASGNLVEPGEFEIDAGTGHALELAHALHDDGLGGVDLEKAAQDGPDYEDADEYGNHQRHGFHAMPPSTVFFLPGTIHAGKIPHAGIEGIIARPGGLSQCRS